MDEHKNKTIAVKLIVEARVRLPLDVHLDNDRDYNANHAEENDRPDNAPTYFDPILTTMVTTMQIMHKNTIVQIMHQPISNITFILEPKLLETKFQRAQS